MSGRYRNSDIDMSGRYVDSHFGEIVERPDAGIKQRRVLPKGKAMRKAYFNRPFSQIAAIFGLSGIPSQIVIGIPITTRAVNMGISISEKASNAQRSKHDSGAFSQKDKPRRKAYLTGRFRRWRLYSDCQVYRRKSLRYSGNDISGQ